MELMLIPEVKELSVLPVFLQNKKIAVPEELPDLRLRSALLKLPQDPAGTPVHITVTGGEGEGYRLCVHADVIDITAETASGAFYGIQTLRQLFKMAKVPCVEIKDSPDFPYRGFYHDVTRGQIPKVETIKKLIDDMAYYKLNSLQLYVEHVFPFEETKDLAESCGCLTGDELREIGDYCRENFIDFIPSLSTFGHMYDTLEQPQYRHLRVLKDYVAEPNFWYARMAHHTIDPLQQESFELVKSLIDQYMPYFDSEWFNICCDETFDLKTLENQDVGKVYVEFVKKIIDHVRGSGKKVMMWADILLEHPEVIGDLPEETMFLNWYYNPIPEQMSDKVSRFAQSGRKQIVCPGTWTWHRLCENVADEECNITGMIDLGWKHGAVGVLNTNWGDWGNPCSLALGMYGMVLGAAKSWNVATNPGESFYNKVNALLYGSRWGMPTLIKLSKLHDAISWKAIADHYFCGENSKYELPTRQMVEKVQQEYLTILWKVSNEEWEQDDYRKEILLAAGGVCALAQLAAKLGGFKVSQYVDTEEWLKQYRAAWLSKNKESELRNIEALFSC